MVMFWLWPWETGVLMAKLLSTTLGNLTDEKVVFGRPDKAVATEGLSGSDDVKTRKKLVEAAQHAYRWHLSRSRDFF